MGWVKPDFTDGDPLYASQLNHIADGIDTAIHRVVFDGSVLTFTLDADTQTLYITTEDENDIASVSD